MLIPVLATAIRIVWVSIEFPYLLRNKVRPAKDWDKHSSKLWDTANVIELFGILLGFMGIGRMQTMPTDIGAVGIVLLVVGIGIRWAAILTLGKYFTGLIVIKDDHQFIRTGLYKHLRHPAYTGTLLAHLGLGLSFANWFSLGLSSIPFVIVALYRMHVEELALEDTFGSAYLAYKRTAKRLIPGLY